MDRFGSPSEEHQPITWLRGYPIYATHLIVLVYVVSMIATSLVKGFMGVNAYGVANWLAFDTASVFHGQLWRYLTYGLWNPPSLSPFAFDMLFLFMFGREVEKFLGRLTFLRLFAGLYLLTPLLFTVIGIWRPMALVGETGAFAVFIAFATLYPEAVLMFNVLAKWAAFILVGIFTLMALSDGNLPVFLSLWATVLFAFGFVRHQQGHFSLPRLNLFRRGPKLRVLPDLGSEPGRGVKAIKGNSMAEVDALLDKIAQSGISSLTAKERAKLDRAREELKNRGAGHS
ncbi:MAG: rhomboid family intramembrane serine protease [Opitutaceae bacterium]